MILLFSKINIYTSVKNIGKLIKKVCSVVIIQYETYYKRSIRAGKK